VNPSQFIASLEIGEQNQTSAPRGFTLIELLVVIAIIAIRSQPFASL
jgi:prepilin-type N-terminal cleavage/methylation domain-containing protein